MLIGRSFSDSWSIMRKQERLKSKNDPTKIARVGTGGVFKRTIQQQVHQQPKSNIAFGLTNRPEFQSQSIKQRLIIFLVKSNDVLS